LHYIKISVHHFFSFWGNAKSSDIFSFLEVWKQSLSPPFLKMHPGFAFVPLTFTLENVLVLSSGDAQGIGVRGSLRIQRLNRS
jgi:hypothetical protein